MALTTFAELKTSIADFLARDDLTAFIPDFITLFECTAVRRLRIRVTTTSATLTPSSGIATVPTDMLGFIRVTWTGTPRVDLEYVHPSYFEELYPDRVSGTPGKYTVEGSSLKVGPLSDTGLDVVYYKRTAALSASLNNIFTNHPDLYLFGSLVEAEAFNKDAEKAALWKLRRDEVFSEILAADFRERGPMAIRVHGLTP
jgi:hypothetical protein